MVYFITFQLANIREYFLGGGEILLVKDFAAKCPKYLSLGLFKNDRNICIGFF
jgi:hypothetical protein